MCKPLRDRKLGEFKFRRQMPIGGYIADVCCPALKPIIELGFENEAVLHTTAVVFEAVRRHAARQAMGGKEDQIDRAMEQAA